MSKLDYIFIILIIISMVLALVLVFLNTFALDDACKDLGYEKAKESFNKGFCLGNGKSIEVSFDCNWNKCVAYIVE